MKKFPLTIISFCLLVISGCQQDASGRILFKNNIGDYQNRSMHQGESISLTAEGGEYDSIAVFLNGKRQPASFKLSESNSHFGGNQLKLLVYYDDSEKMERTATVMVLPETAPRRSNYRVVGRYPHNTNNFTEGFLYENGMIYEGTGLRGSSKLLVYELATGKVVQLKELSSEYFGEGVAKIGDSIFQLTYKAQKAFVYNSQTLEQVHEFSFPFSAEGWGLCFDGKYLVMSNGSHLLYFINPKDFSLHHTLQVVDNNGFRDQLNELEYRDGKIYANVWYETDILVIDAQSGAVEEVILIPEIPAGTNRDAVANGIAFKDDNLLVTGKNWPLIFELEPVDQKRPIQ